MTVQFQLKRFTIAAIFIPGNDTTYLPQKYDFQNSIVANFILEKTPFSKFCNVQILLAKLNYKIPSGLS